MNYLIAFMGKPKPGFLDLVVKMAAQDGVKITGGILCPGPGCSNLAIVVEHEDHKNFVEQLTMALQPAKYEVCADPRLKAGEFITEVE